MCVSKKNLKHQQFSVNQETQDMLVKHREYFTIYRQIKKVEHCEKIEPITGQINSGQKNQLLSFIISPHFNHSSLNITVRPVLTTHVLKQYILALSKQIHRLVF